MVAESSVTLILTFSFRGQVAAAWTLLRRRSLSETAWGSPALIQVLNSLSGNMEGEQ